MSDKNDTGKYPVLESNENKSLRRSHEVVNDPLLQRIQLKFRQAVGQAMEEIADEEIREGIRRIQQEVVLFLHNLKLKHELDDEILQSIEDEHIKAKVDAFIAKSTLNEERFLRKELVKKNKDLEERLNSNQAELKKEMYDDLTGVLRKKYLLSSFNKTLSLLQREAFDVPVEVSVMFFDVDHFKKVNDTYGHQTGDEVLAGMGQVVGERFQRGSDSVGRYGGEEFVVVMPRCNEHNAGLLAEELRKKVEAKTFTTFKDGQKVEFNVTVSIGVVTAALHKFVNGDLEKAMYYIINQADNLLYDSKQTGRNKVTIKKVDVGERSDGEEVLI